MTIPHSFTPDPPPFETAQAPPSHDGSNLPADEPVWAAARRSYVEGCSSPVVAERHGLNERTVRRRAAEENWAEVRARWQVVEAQRRRAAVLAGDPPTEDEALARAPELADFVAAHSFEVGELLLKPGAERLSRFAFRRAAEMAAQGRPQEATVWMRLVTAVDRAADRIEANTQLFSPADHLRAHYAGELRRAFEGEPDGDDRAGDEQASDRPPAAGGVRW